MCSYGARYFDPMVSMWIGEDPLAEKYPDWSPFAYTMNKPINYVDPTGMNTEEGGGDPVVTIKAKRLPRSEVRPYSPKVKPSEKIVANPIAKFAVQVVEEAVEGITYIARSGFYGRGEGVPKVFEDGHTIKGSEDSQTLAVGGLLTIAPFFGKVIKPLSTAANEGCILADASKAAFNAADDVGSIYIKNKHLSSATGNYAKFATTESSTAQVWVQQALRSPNAQFLPNDQIPNTFKVVTNVGTIIGTKGQTSIRAIVGFDGKVINTFPIK